jgi:hypothetical protein
MAGGDGDRRQQSAGPTAAGMLIAVLDEPGMTVAEISQSIPEAQQPISSARLEKLGLIERRHGPGRNKPRPRTTWPSQGRLGIEVLDINDSAQIAALRDNIAPGGLAHQGRHLRSTSSSQSKTTWLRRWGASGPLWYSAPSATVNRTFSLRQRSAS